MRVETLCVCRYVHGPVHPFVHHFVHVHSPIGLRLRELPIKQGLSEDFGSGGRGWYAATRPQKNMGILARVRFGSGGLLKRVT